MFSFISTVIELLIINQLPTFNPVTIGPIGPIGPIITIDPGLFTTTTPSVITRPPPTTTTSSSSVTTLSTITSTSFTSTESSTEDNTVLYIIVGVVFGLFIVLEFWYFVCRKKKNNDVRAENVERLYESIDYSGVYELPTVIEQSNTNPPPIPNRPTYGVRVNTSV